MKTISYEEVSMVGRKLFNKSNQTVKQTIERKKKPLGNLHVIAIAEFYQMAQEKTTCTF